MTRILSNLITRRIDDDRWNVLAAPFTFESDVLAKAGLKSRVTAPAGFVQDGESVPVIRGRNVRGGVVHDYLSCNDSDPLVTKQQAAACYFEINEYCDMIDHSRTSPVEAIDWGRRWAKWAVVRVWPFYFHKRSVFATCQDLIGLPDDPYITLEKLKALIQKSEAVTEDIKDIPVEQKGDLIEASEKVTEDLKDAKADVETSREGTPHP